MTVLTTLTTAGLDAGPFDLYSNVDGYSVAFETGVSRSALLAGYTSTVVPDFTTTVRVKSTGVCTNFIDIPITGITTTTSSTSTTTTTEAPIACISYNVEIPEVNTVTISYYDCNNNPVVLEPLTGPDAIQFCAKEGTILTVPSGTSIISEVGPCP
jgi:hypothetical protein